MRTAPAILLRATPVAALAYVAGFGWPTTIGAATGGWSVAAAGVVVAASLLAGFWLTAPLAANRRAAEDEGTARNAREPLFGQGLPQAEDKAPRVARRLAHPSTKPLGAPPGR